MVQPLADLLQPALTVIAQRTAEIGRTAVEQPVQSVVVPVTLKVRGSGEVPA
ncbi:hypothetical protein AB0I51_12020 [Streptomyces sp. NPDC050549]|uniref:hypothetical protein n=1 Tax=Streptomyces sp. NPDC050549 TaxID=3155406 RepID=UPI00341533CA